MAEQEPVVIQDQLFNDLVRKYQDFIDPGEDSVLNHGYVDAIQKMLNLGEQRVVVSLDDIRDFDRSIADGILQTPSDYVPPFDKALKDVVMRVRDSARHAYIETKPVYVAFKGSFGDHHVTPRSIRSNFLAKMVSLEGIVTRCSLVRPKMIRSVSYCEKTHMHYAKDYKDATMAGGTAITTSSAYPKVDDDGNPLSIEFGYSTFRDHQTVTIQEMPERAPAGQLPRSVDVIMDDDLVDKCKPGDRVQIVGHYMSLGNRNAGFSSSVFRTIILANNIVLLSSKAGGGIAQEAISDRDVRNINKLAKRKDIFELLSRSLAPSIYGNDHIKQAILLLLLGGVEKNLENGTHIRGDINILMVGDPSTAKSQLLRFVLNTAPLAIATTGRGSSGVGLTAAVTTDKETGERRLEAGAMVLADRGVICIDEFDKMSDSDRVAIHEVMEQQTVTIAKAGIHTSLNARCSVVAAANPIYGQYDPHKDPHRNIALPDSLLSRFDLLFIVTDDIDDEKDRRISEHVLQMHRYIAPGAEEGAPVRENTRQFFNVGTQETEAQDTPVFEKASLARDLGARRSKKQHEILNMGFVKKYLQYSHNRIKPVLTKGAADHIVAAFSALRNDDMGLQQRRTSPITARTLETLIRLSTAHAKARLSHRVEEGDAQVAEGILRFALFKELAKSSRKKRARQADEEMSGDESVSESEDEENETEDQDDATYTGTSRPRGTRMATRSSQATQANAATQASSSSQVSWASEHPESQLDSMATGEAPPRESQSMQAQPRVPEAAEVQVSPSRLQQFAARVAALMQTELFAEDHAKLEAILPKVNEGLGQEDVYSTMEARAALTQMAERNQIMLFNDTVFRV